MFLRLILISVFLVLFCLASNAADCQKLGRFVYQSGNAMQVSFDAAWVDGHGAAPEAEGPATVSGSTLTFKFTDTFENSGTGTITRTGDEIIVSINPTHVVDPRCLAFYGKNMRLKRVK